jgi:hypothetical protein
MPIKGSGSGQEWREIDRFEADDEAGFGWIAHPEEGMQRASHALAVDGDVYVVDPVDADGIDDRLADLGEVAGVVLLLARHTRDAAALASRHRVPVHVPDVLSIGGKVDAPVEPIRGELADTGYTVHEIDSTLWTEAALYSEGTETLVVPEAVGTADFFCAREERLGVHPALRLTPPRRLGQFDPERVLVGHGAGVHDDAAAALSEGVSRARSRAPGLYLKTLRSVLPV